MGILIWFVPLVLFISVLCWILVIIQRAASYTSMRISLEQHIVREGGDPSKLKRLYLILYLHFTTTLLGVIILAALLVSLLIPSLWEQLKVFLTFVSVWTLDLISR